MKIHNNAFLQLVEEALEKVPEIDIHQVNQKLQKQDNFFLIDVREESEWNNGRIPGSIYLGKGIIERDIMKIIQDLDSEIVLYCQGGFRSALAGENIKRMGFHKVYSMSGGYGEWEINFPIEK
tara:strand:- start:10239 stop:10607 length:369 start_codon:yes stop_codon:yes gene_type:complete